MMARWEGSVPGEEEERENENSVVLLRGSRIRDYFQRGIQESVVLSSKLGGNFKLF